MALSRRKFFGAMVAAGVAATIDPEELFWTPGKTKFFIPPAPAPQPAIKVLRYDVAILENRWTAVPINSIADMESLERVLGSGHGITLSEWT